MRVGHKGLAHAQGNAPAPALLYACTLKQIEAAISIDFDVLAPKIERGRRWPETDF